MSLPALPLDGRVAVVMGGTSGIGLALARGLAAAGAHVVPVSRRREQVDAAAAEVEGLGRRSLRVTADVADRASLDAALRETVAAFGKVDVLVNCAGITRRTPTLDVTEEEWASILDTNLTGTFRACQVFGRHMLDRGYGRIVNVASLASFVGLFEVAAYTASKAGVAGLTRALAVEWGRRGVNVNAIAPGVFAPRSTRSCSTASAAASSCSAPRCGATGGWKSWRARACSSRRRRRASSTAR